jgi:hypothetical protein
MDDATQALADEKSRRPPACHTWPLPTLRTDEDSADTAFGLLGEWQDDRCAGCGYRGDLVIDHDHDTGLVRGLLCRSCNTFEPHAEPGTTLAMYRERPPVAILQLTPWRYVSPWSGEAQPRDSGSPGAW